MTLDGVHLLLTYQCTFECDHCFVWGGPRQTGTMGLGAVREILSQATDLGTVEWIYFEGGEPFLFHPVLARGVCEAAGLGFQVGLVTNGYWATGIEEAIEWLRPFAGRINDLSLSNDDYHGGPADRGRVEVAREAARRLGIPTGEIAIAAPGGTAADGATGQLPAGVSGVMYRGRAAVALAPQAVRRPWESFDACPHEDLREPGRVHVDPFGFVHLCQGITIGNLFQAPLSALCAFDPDADPIVGPLLAGGPAALVRRHGLAHAAAYADACHLCYEARTRLRPSYRARLGPDQMYGVDGVS